MPILRNITTGADLSADVRRATSPLDRVVGWLGSATIPAHEGKWLKPCSAIHTLGMRSAIDVIVLDRESTVVELMARVRPNRLWVSHRRAASIIEMGPGFLDRATLAVGDRLELITAESPASPESENV